MDVGSVRIASTAPQEIAAALERHGPVERAVIETGRMTPSVALGLRELGVLIVCIDARQRRRFGYRRLHVLLRREGVMINRKRTQRLYQEEGLAVRRRRSRKRAVGTRAPAPVLALPNQRWNLDFVHDQMAFGRRVRVLNIVDDVTRECLRAVPDTSDLRSQGRAGVG